MKTPFRFLFTGMFSVVFLSVLLLVLTANEITAVTAQPLSFPQIKTIIYSTNAVTPTVFLPLIQKPIPPLPQGYGLLFISDRAETEKYDIYSMNLDGGNVKRLTNLSIDSYAGFNHSFLPRWSPDGKQFAVQIEGALYLYSSDGSSFEALLDETMVAADGIPSWSPDGQKIAFKAKDCTVARPLCNEFAGGGVRVINVQTRGITQSIPDGIHMSSIASVQWLPDGHSLMAVPNESDGNGIIIGYLDGTPAQWILTTYSVRDFEISPDGQKIVFEADFNFRAYTSDITGDNVKTIFDGVSDVAFVTHTTWHPSGNQLAYVVSRNSGTDRTIYVANANGSGAHDILPSFHSSGLGVWGWTPDGSKIIFQSDKNRDWLHYDIYTVNGDGSNRTNLTPDSPRDDVAADYFP